jgi:PAS domain S-box-containing protein
MPGVDGLGLVRRIRRAPPIHTVPLVVLSARAGEEARLEALDAGADDYLVKPFSARELIARVRGHVQMARLRRAAIEQEGALRRQIAAVKGDLASVLAGTSDCFIAMDRDLLVLSMNESALAAFGRGGEDATGRHIVEVLPPMVDGTLLRNLHAAVVHGRAGAAECFFVDTQRWYEARCYPAPHGAIMFANDISARKRAEQALRQAHAGLEQRVAQRTAELSAANQLLKAVFERAPGGIVVTALDGRLLQANRAYAELAGRPLAALQGRLPDEWIEEAGLVRLRAGRARLLAGTCDSFQAEARYRLPDGRRVWVAHFVSMMGNAWRGEQCFVTIAWDVTTHKRSEEERLTSARELQVLYERLQTVREAERTALAREVHDQLGQILSAAKIDIKLIEDGLRAAPGPMPGAAIVAELGSASHTLERAITLVREIATRLRAPELDEQGLYAAVDWHARDFERRTRIACHLAFDPQRPHPSRAAAAAVLRIFQEALTNVLRHAQATEVCVEIEARGGLLFLRVRDNGVGVAPGRVRIAGTLGLQGMRERAELVDGRLWVRRIAPQGTLVSARVPLQRREERA